MEYGINAGVFLFTFFFLFFLLLPLPHELKIDLRWKKASRCVVFPFLQVLHMVFAGYDTTSTKRGYLGEFFHR